MAEDDVNACCVSPQKVFRVRAGEVMLANDTPTAMFTPEGIISPEGIFVIREYLRDVYRETGCTDYYSLSHDLMIVGDEWQTARGNYPKRLSRHAHEIYRITLSSGVMSGIGTLAREHSKGVGITIEVTRKLNEKPWFFYNDDSCWWGGESESRCALKTNGGYALRALRDGTVTGRAWVLPVRGGASLYPTFNTETPDALIVFNGYGALAGYAPARLLGQMHGWTYKRIGFTCSPMYANSAVGYLVAPEQLVKATEQVKLSLYRHSGLFDRELSAKAAEENAREGITDVTKEL